MDLKLDYLNEIAGGDTEFINEILETYLNEIPKDMQILHQAITSKDLSKVQKIAHKMKSSFRLLGLSDLHDASLNLENAAKQEIADWINHQKSLDFIQTQVNTSLVLVKKTIQ